MKTLLSFAVALCLVPTIVSAERLNCVFPESKLQIPTDVKFVLSDFSDRVLIDDSVRRPLERGRHFGDVDVDTIERLRITWRFDDVPRPMLRRIAHPLPRHFLDYQLTVQKSDMSAVVVVTNYVVGAQQEVTRAHGRCQRLSE
ncbi:MAG: hypothetical protein AAFY77_00130 [Pseudomonadota bacterium]